MKGVDEWTTDGLGEQMVDVDGRVDRVDGLKKWMDGHCG